MAALVLNSFLNINIPGLKLQHKGKVRNIYEIDEDHLLFVASDRISAFDVVSDSQVVDGKGIVLTDISHFWFNTTKDIIPNHTMGVKLTIFDVIEDPELATQLAPRSMVVRKLTPLPIEAIVRGYIIGSGWKDYQNTGAICGIELPPGLSQAEQIPGGAIYTPSTKAEVGDHDENISFDETTIILANFLYNFYNLGPDRCDEILEKAENLAEQVKTVSLELYTRAAKYALERGIIIADTKFEFGLDPRGELVLSDEVLTPDSSRFWPLKTYKVGESPKSFDKQEIRDHLDGMDWDKTPPMPLISPEVLRSAKDNYPKIFEMLTS